jgi:hypothetical protein
MISSILFFVLVELSINKFPLKITKKSLEIFEWPKLAKQLEILGLTFITEEEVVPMSKNKDYMVSREEWIKKEKDWKY